MPAPERERRAAEIAMLATMIAARDLRADPALELAQHEPLRMWADIGIALAALHGADIGDERNAAEAIADQRLYMRAIAGARRLAPNRLDPDLAADAHEGATAEKAVGVDMDRFGKSGDRPIDIDPALGEPARLVADGVQNAEARRKARRRREREMKARRHARERIDPERDPGPADLAAGLVVDDYHIDFRVIDLNGL